MGQIYRSCFSLCVNFKLGRFVMKQNKFVIFEQHPLKLKMVDQPTIPFIKHYLRKLRKYLHHLASLEI